MKAKVQKSPPSSWPVSPAACGRQGCGSWRLAGLSKVVMAFHSSQEADFSTLEPRASFFSHAGCPIFNVVCFLGFLPFLRNNDVIM